MEPWLLTLLLFVGVALYRQRERALMAWALYRARRTEQPCGAVWLREPLSSESNDERFDEAQRVYAEQASRPVDVATVEHWPMEAYESTLLAIRAGHEARRGQR